MRRTAVTALVLAVLLAAWGCGGGDDESAADTEAAATTAPATTEAEPTEAPDFASAANCAELVSLGLKVSLALGGTGGADVEKTKELLNAFSDEAPEEIRADFEVIAEAYAKIGDTLGDLGLTGGETPTAEDQARLQQLAAELDQPALTRANENITAWVNENCQSG
jgi:hypothetical protein